MKVKKLLSVLFIGILLVTSACNKDAETSDNQTNGYDPLEYAESGKSDYEISGTYNPLDYVELGEYKGLPLDLSVSEEELKEEIDSILEENRKYEEITQGEVKKGDTISMNFEGSMDGVPFDGGSAEDYLLEDVGAGYFIDGFEDQIIGKKVGEEFMVNVTFPDDYFNEELAGKPAEFKVKVNYIRGAGQEIAFNDEFVKSLDEGYETAEEYKKEIKEGMVDDKRDEGLNRLFDQAIQNAKIKDYPQTIMDIINKRFDTTTKVMAKEQFESFEEYLKAYQMTQEDYDNYLKETVKGYVGEIMVAAAIAKTENIKLTEDEFNEMMDSYMKNHGKETEKDLAKLFQDEYSANLRDVIHEALTSQKVMEYLETQATVTK